MADHPVLAAVYDFALRPAERAGLAERRRRLLSHARGRVLEVGGGTGLNLPHYRDVEGVVVLEPDGAMRRRLRERVVAAAVPVEVHEAGIDEADLADGSFDTIVCTLGLCTVPDPAGALTRIARLLAAGGSLLFIEHVKWAGWRGRLQRAADPLWTRLAGGCHLDRDSLATVRTAGFLVSDCERFRLLRGNLLTGNCVQGVARPRTATAPAA